MANWNNYTEEELIEGCQKHERKYQEMVYRKYASQMYPICLSYASSRSEAQDILQEGFLKVFRRIDSFKYQGSFAGWIRRIITNTAIDQYRSSKRQKDDYVLNETIYEDKEVSNEILDQIGEENILNKVRLLPKGARMIFNLYAIEGYSHKEISERLNISVGTSKSQYKRARSLLQEWLLKDD